MAQAQAITLKFAHFLASTHNFHKGVAEHWCNAIEKDSGGKLKCQIYPALQLGGTRAMREYTQKYAMEDFKDFKVLAIFSGSNVVISTAKKPVLGVDVLNGLKLRTPSRYAAPFLSGLGGATVPWPLGRYYLRSRLTRSPNSIWKARPTDLGSHF